MPLALPCLFPTLSNFRTQLLRNNAKHLRSGYKRKNSRNIYYSLAILHVVLIILYLSVWSWSYLPFGTLIRSFLIMVSFSSIPLAELIIIALVYMTWAGNKAAKYFELYVVLSFSHILEVRQLLRRQKSFGSCSRRSHIGESRRYLKMDFCCFIRKNTRERRRIMLICKMPTTDIIFTLVYIYL